MKNILRSIFLLFSFSFLVFNANAQSKKDTVKVGIYITSIHDIDFKQKEYAIDFWLWLKYKNKDFDFIQNLEIPQAKSVNKYFSTVDSSKGIFIQMKLQCVMKDSWKISNFPFDKQKLRLSIENSQYDSSELVFTVDTLGQNFDPRFTLNGWKIDSCITVAGTKIYETSFGDDTQLKPRSIYSNFKVRLDIKRDATGLFWKMFLGMYIAFLIAYMCFFIHADSMDSRFGLSVGALFAVIGNKYVVDASLPETTSFTLVDTLHCLTLVFILCVVMTTCYSLVLVKNNKIAKSNRFDKIMSITLLLIYVGLNVWFISQATTN
jgi:hypothetical protein